MTRDERIQWLESILTDSIVILDGGLGIMIQDAGLAESFAEHLHRRVRTEFWGYAANERLSNEELIREKYCGIRPALGYPACPDHREKRSLWSLLDAEAVTGISLTDSLAMWPTASVSGFYFAHPDARYFTLGQIGKNQLTSYLDL